MTKAKPWLCIAALLLALMSPAAWADDSGGPLNWIEQIVAQIAASFSDSGGTAELGELVPVGGTPAVAPGSDSGGTAGLGEYVPVSGTPVAPPSSDSGGTAELGELAPVGG